MLKNEKGIILMFALALTMIFSIIGINTIFLSRAEIIEAGIQKRKLQSFYAAEAGVARVIRNLNWDHYWAQEIEGWQAGDMSIDHSAFNETLPDVWGKNGQFKVHGIRVLKLLPDIIEILVDGGFDRNLDNIIDERDKTILKVKLRLGALSDYFRFVESTSGLSYGGGAHIQGKVYTGGDLRIWGNNVIFDSRVTTGGELKLITVTDTASIVFKKGISQNSSKSLTLDQIHIDENDPDGVFPGTYKDLAAGNVAGKGSGLVLPASLGENILIDLDNVILNADNSVSVTAFNANDLTESVVVTSDTGGTFNGIIYANADVSLKGVLRNVSLTIASADDIIIRDNVICSGNEYNSKSPVTLGGIAQDQLLIDPNSPTMLTIEGSFIAENDEINDIGLEQGVNDNKGWQALGTNVTHDWQDFNNDGLINSEDWKLTFKGSIITKSGGSSGKWANHGSSTHISREYLYDNDLYYNPPPEFPLIDGVVGAPVYEIVSWQEL